MLVLYLDIQSRLSCKGSLCNLEVNVLGYISLGKSLLTDRVTYSSKHCVTSWHSALCWRDHRELSRGCLSGCELEACLCALEKCLES